MTKRMLIDASQPEETRVAVVSGHRIDEFDFESATKKQITGNIYLAKVVRVEPSLQAAFVEYGGNRHGFLAFAEIHPDYYQIPHADRQALLERHAAAARRSRDTFDDDKADDGDNGRPSPKSADRKSYDEPETAPRDTQASDEAEGEGPIDGIVDEVYDPDAQVIEEVGGGAPPGSFLEPGEEDNSGESPASPNESSAQGHEADSDDDNSSEAAADDTGSPEGEDAQGDGAQPAQGRGGEDRRRGRHRRRRRPEGEGDEGGEVENLGGDDGGDEMARPRLYGGRPYKIQEVIKRRQILLVQVVKEERGNKGAALTSYLSLAGRYCVLMPNTGRGGGISRKITNAVDRKRLKAIANELEVPEGMGLIIRTAGANRTKVEIKRDFEYLMRLWENVRDTTMNSVAPALIMEEGSLIKRAIRDLYSKDIDVVQVEGDEGYREAKEFMRMLMPSHAKNVQAYRDPVPLFLRTQVESQLDALFSPQVQLKSGGYLVIDQTEALVAIDVNSGRSTREHNIEDTALKTNLEAADEVARQLRLRDLAGLIVVDFIDMDDPRNNRAVERRLKEALKADRARIQIGRISAFGLLEMSRQRLRSSVMEISSNNCPMCNGAGVVRSVESTALHVIRGIEQEGLNGRSAQIVVRLPHAIAMFLLNQKRDTLTRIEERYGFQVMIDIDHGLIPPDYHIERFGTRPERPDLLAMRAPPDVEEIEPADLIEEDDDEETFEAEAGEDRVAADPRGDAVDGESEEAKRRRKRRRRRRNGRREDEPGDGVNAEAGDVKAEDAGEDDGEDEDGTPKPAEGRNEAQGDNRGDGRRRRRGRRGGRRQRGDDPAASFASGDQPDVPPDAWVTLQRPADAPVPQTIPEPVATAPEPVSAPPVAAEPSKPAAPYAPASLEPAPLEPAPAPVAEEPPTGPPRKGWWKRTFSL